MKFTDTSVAIIAGGKSERFGEPKDRALLNGQSLLEYALNLALALSPQVALFSGRNEIILPENIAVYSDSIPDSGPLGGIFTALYHLPTPFIATLPCDMPLLTVEVYHLLYAHRTAHRPVVAVSEKGLEPLVAIWPQGTARTVLNNLITGKLSLRKSLGELNALQIYLPDALPNYHPDIFLNINYKKDLEKLVQRFEESPLSLSI